MANSVWGFKSGGKTEHFNNVLLTTQREVTDIVSDKEPQYNYNVTATYQSVKKYVCIYFIFMHKRAYII